MSGALRTPLYAAHVRLGARMVEFAGFDMPVQYTSILAEHAAVRERAGLFDVSHMGQIHLRGPSALATADHLLSRPMASLRVGRVRYALLCNEAGGVVDDVTVYRLADDHVFLCVNASNIEKDYRWIVRHSPDDAGVRNASDETGLLALQGPASCPVTTVRAPLIRIPGLIWRSSAVSRMTRSVLLWSKTESASIRSASLGSQSRRPACLTMFFWMARSSIEKSSAK